MENKAKKKKLKYDPSCLYEDSLMLEQIEPYELLIQKYLIKRKNQK